MTRATRRSILQGIAAVTALAASPRALTQAAQLESAKILAGFPPGGTTDVIARRLADRLRGNYAKTVVVDNKAGAGGRLAIELLKPAAPDGTTLLVTPASMVVIYPHIYRKLSYDPFADLTPVSSACSTVFALAVGPAVPESVRTLRDFIAWCKANPGQSNYGSPAAGSVPHFLGALLERAAGIEFRHIAFRGSQPAVLDMMGGQLTSVSAPMGEFLPHLKTGKARVLATSGTERSKFVPEVPTFIEQGFGDVQAREWFGVFLPGRAPADSVQRAAAAVRAAVSTGEFAEGIAQMGLEAGASSPDGFAKLIRADHDRWGPIVKQIGFTAES